MAVCGGINTLSAAGQRNSRQKSAIEERSLPFHGSIARCVLSSDVLVAHEYFKRNRGIRTAVLGASDQLGRIPPLTPRLPDLTGGR
jgi:hypothetical protein